MHLSRFACYLIVQNGDPRRSPGGGSAISRFRGLAANQFRMTQTREKLTRDQVRHQAGAIVTHEQVGREVREAIDRIGGTSPENIPADEHIKQVEKRVKTAPAKLELEGPHASGLKGSPQGARRS